MEDLIIEVDKNNNVLGLRPREDFYGGKYIHRSSHLLLFNTTGELAIMKRSTNKRWYPNLYTFSVSGTVDNETNTECIKREIKEEIGLDLEPKELFTFRHFDNQDSAFATVYFAVSDKNLIPDKQEISEVKLILLEQLKDDMISNPDIYTLPFLLGMKAYFEKYGSELPK